MGWEDIEDFVTPDHFCSRQPRKNIERKRGQKEPKTKFWLLWLQLGPDAKNSKEVLRSMFGRILGHFIAIIIPSFN